LTAPAPPQPDKFETTTHLLLEIQVNK